MLTNRTENNKKRFEMRKKIMTGLIGLIAFVSISAKADTGIVALGKTAKPPVLDGHLNDACWRGCVETGNFIQHQGEVDPAKEDTKVRLTYDDKNIYLAFTCIESHLNPVLNQETLFKAAAGKDAADSLKVFRDDCIEIFLSCSAEISNDYYQIAVNSRGTIYDSSSSKGIEWDSDAVAVGTKDEKGWYLEIAIPLKNLTNDKITPEKTVWRGNFCRNTKPVHETSSWNRATAKGFHSPDIFGELRFIKTTPGVLGVELSKFKNGVNSIHTGFINTTDAALETSLTMNCLFDDSESASFANQKSIPAGESTKLNLNYNIDTSNRCVSYAFNDPKDPTVTIAKTTALDFKPSRKYRFEADVASDLKRKGDGLYNFFLLRSKTINYKAIKGAEVPLISKGWIRVKGEIETAEKISPTELWLVKWSGRRISGKIKFDNLRIIDTATGENLITNGSFQNGPSGWTTLRKIEDGYGNSAEKMTYNYSIYSDSMLLYRSPTFKRGLSKENPSINSQLVNFGETGMYKIEDLYLGAGAAERLNLVLKSNRNDSIDKVFFEIEMPHSCRLLFSSLPSETISPLDVSEKTPDCNRRVYTLTFNRAAVSDSDSFPWEYVSIPLIIRNRGWKTKSTSGEVRFRAWIDEKDQESLSHKLKLRLLSPLAGRRPRKLPLLIWGYSALPSFKSLPKDLRGELVRKISNSGFNYGAIRRENVNEFKRCGVKAFTLLPTITISSNFPLVSTFLKSHPDCSARYSDGTPANAIDPAYLLNDDCLFHKQMKRVFKAYLEVFPDSLDWDYEFSFMNPKNKRARIGFSKRNLEMFKQYSNIPNSVKSG